MFAFVKRKKNDRSVDPTLSSGPASETAGVGENRDGLVKRLLNSQENTLKSLRLKSAARKEDFDEYWLPAIMNLAEYVHMLPASREYFKAPGGMFALCLATAEHALNLADSFFFDKDKDNETRRRNKAFWNYAAYIGGLVHPLGLLVHEMEIHDGQGHIWNPYRSGVLSWSRALGSSRYHLRWKIEDRPRDLGKASAYLARNLIPDEVWAFLAPRREIFEELLVAIGSLGNKPDELFSLAQIVQESMRTVIEDDMSRSQANGAAVEGLTIKHHIVDALRTLFRNKWELNAPGSPVWNLGCGLFLWWPKVVNDLMAELKRKQLAGLPENPETLLDVMHEHDIVVLYEGKEIFWPVQIGGDKMPRGILDMVRLYSPRLVLGPDAPRYAVCREYEIGYELSEITTTGSAAPMETNDPDAIPQSLVGSDAEEYSEFDDVDDDQNMPLPLGQPPVSEVAEEGSEHVSEQQAVKTSSPAEEERIEKDRSSSLEKYGEAAPLLKAIIEDCEEGQWEAGVDIFWSSRGPGLCVLYPKILRSYGSEAPQEKELLQVCGCLYVGGQKKSPFEKYRIDGKERNFIVLRQEVGEDMCAYAQIEIPAFCENDASAES